MQTQALSAAQAERRWRRRYYRIYTLAFWLTALVVFASFLQTNRSLIWNPDGWQQHYKALCYYSEYLRKIARTLLHEHRLVIPNWEYSFGEGSDVLTTLHYYVMGDPLALLCVFVPKRLMHYFYSFCCVLRMYLAGLAFSALAIGTGKRSRHGILAAALSYAFCLWGLLNAARHPYFLNPMIWFPLLILGVEKILAGKRPYLFVAAAALSAASNFYFFYIIAILGVLYALVRLLLWQGPDWKRKLALLLRMFLFAVLAVCIAAVILLPVILIFLNDSRASVPIPFQLFYPPSYYATLPAVALGIRHPYWAVGGYSAPMLLGFIALFVRKKQSRLLRVLCGLCGLFLLFPIVGRLFNGMSYAINRWIWALALLGAYVLADQWEGLFPLSPQAGRRAFRVVMALFAWLLLSSSARSPLTLAVCFLLLLALQFARSASAAGRMTPQRAMLLLTGLSVCLMGTWFYAPGFNNYLSECIPNDELLYRREHTEAHAVKELAYEVGPRYSGADPTHNAGVMAGISSTQAYWSNSNPWLNRYKTELELNESTYSKTENYDGRTTPLTLASVQYYTYNLVNEEQPPYGFSQLHTVWLRQDELEDRAERLRQELGVEALSEAQEARLMQPLSASRVDIGHTKYAMPLGYCYDRQISRESWEALDPVQRQQIQLDAVCVEDPRGEAGSALPVWEGGAADYALPYEIEYLSDDVTPVEGGFLTTAKNACVRLHFRGVPNAETYLRFVGLRYDESVRAELYGRDTEVDPLELYNQTDLERADPALLLEMRKEALYHMDGNYYFLIPVSSSAGAQRYLELRSADNNFSAGRSSMILNLGYQEQAVTSLTVRLPRIGRYCFEDLQVYAVSMDGFGEKIDALRADSLQNPREATDLVTGSIDLAQPKLLVVTLPYSAGWTALVDGKPAPVLLANGRYLGLDLSAGHHEIELHYATPYLRAGALISALSLLLLALGILAAELRRRKARKSGERR